MNYRSSCQSTPHNSVVIAQISDVLLILPLAYSIQHSVLNEMSKYTSIARD